MLAKARNTKRTEDRFDFFGKSVAEQLRNLPTSYAQSLAMLRIQECIHNYGFENLPQQTTQQQSGEHFSNLYENL
jgi:hypothetical protein